MIRKILAILALQAVAATVVTAQQVRPASSAQVYHELSQLNRLVHVLYVAAHPDDENTRFLAWMANDQHVPVAYLSLTRGDGGQNILGSEQGAALGLIRTHELMEARRLDGAGQYFTRAVDFGFSKNPDETFKHWNAYLLTHDVVWVMRKFRPDVVICRFPPTKEAGHGQHSASAILAARAFGLAGDKLQYTEELQYVQPWQPKRLLFNAYRFGDNNTTSESQFKLAVGQYNPMLGMGYGELAGQSRSIHKSQGAGTPSVAGVQQEYFKLVAGDSISNSLFDGIDITWNRVGRKEIGTAIDKIISSYDQAHPEKILPALLDLRKQIVTVKDDYWRREKLSDLDALILHCSGLMAEAVTKQPQSVVGASLPFTLNIIARPGNTPIQITGITWPNQDSSLNMRLPNDTLTSFTHTVTIPAGTPVSEPYWLSHPADGVHYAIPQDTLLGLPETPDNLDVQVTLRIGETELTVPVPLSSKKLDPLKGDVTEALRIVPDVSVELAAGLLVTQADGSAHTSVRLHAFKDITNGTLVIYGNNKKMMSIGGIHIRANADTMVPLHITAQQSDLVSKDDYVLDAVLEAGGQTYNRTQRLIQYSHLPTLQYFTMPVAQVLRSNWKVTAKRIGYIEGAGDYIPTLLRLAGLDVEVLKEADLTDAARLKKYDAIISGVRAVNVEKRMSYWMPVLMQYVSNGGTLLMQYNTLQDMATTNIGPYPLTLSNLRVTEEDAPVTLLQPQHRLMTYPNKITDNDFKGWVQERGLNFPSKWDDHYQPLLQMNDTGEQPLKGSLLYAPYGKGHYIYTSLSLFRELPAANKGSIRLLMNMLSVGK